MTIQEFFNILENQTEINKDSQIKKFAKKIFQRLATNYSSKPFYIGDENINKIPKGFVVKNEEITVTTGKYRGTDEIRFWQNKTFTVTKINSDYRDQPWFGVWNEYFIVNNADEPGKGTIYKMK